MAPGPRNEADDDPLRRAAQYRVDREIANDQEASGSPAPDQANEGDEGKRQLGNMTAEERARYVDVVVDQAMRRGEFDNLPLHGKPIPGLTGTHDPDWWVKGLIERENITGVLPSAQLRKDAAELDGKLDLEVMEERVRQIVTDFNARVIDARRQLQGGPPIVTPTRDVDEEVRRWAARRAARQTASTDRAPGARQDPAAPGNQPWWKFW